jgi:hypothetical protein
MKLRRNFLQRTRPIHSIGPTTHVLGRFGPFHYCTKVDAKLDNSCYWRTSLLNEVTSENFATNAPDTLHWTQNLSFGAFRTVRYWTNVHAKLAELVPLTHKFAKRRYVTKFRNECNRSTPLDPKLIFWGISDRFVTARKSMQSWPNWCH